MPPYPKSTAKEVLGGTEEVEDWENQEDQEYQRYCRMTPYNLGTTYILRKELSPLCPIHVVTFTLISIRRGEPGLFPFEYNLLPNLVSN